MKSEIWIADELSRCRKELTEFYNNNPEIDDNPILETKINTLKLILEEEVYEEHMPERQKLTEVAD